MAKKKNRDRAVAPDTVPANAAPPSPESAGFSLPAFLASPPVLMGFVAMILYSLTLARTVVGGDSSELTLVAETLGIAHPPGYPIFTMLGWLFTKFPLGEIAFRVNLLSAVCDAIAVGFVTAAVSRWSRSSWAGVVAGGLFAFSPLVWAYAVVAEVFAINNFFLAIFLYLTIRYVETRELKVARFAALWAGLGLCNHHSYLFYAFPCSLYFLWVGRRDGLLKPAELARLIGLFALGFLPYAYLPIASSRAPFFAWGDQTTWDGFWTHFLRREYGTFRLASTSVGVAGGVMLRTWRFLATMPRELGYVGLPLAVYGLYKLWTDPTRRSLNRIFVGMVVAYVGVFCALANLPFEIPLYAHIQARFWQQATLVFCVWAGMGFAYALALLPEARRAQAAVALALAFVALPAGLNYKRSDQSKNRMFEQFAKGVMQLLPKDTLLVTSGDNISNVLRYYQRHARIGAGIRMIDHAVLSYPWSKRMVETNVKDIVFPGLYLNPRGVGTYSLKMFFEANYGRGGPIFMVNGVRVADDTYKDDFNPWPIGMVELFLKKSQELKLDEWLRNSDWMASTVPEKEWAKFPEGTWENDLYRLFWRMRYIYGVKLVVYATQHPGDPLPAERATQVLEEVERQPVFTMKPELFRNTADLYRNAGLAYQLLVASKPAAKAKMVEWWKKYLATNPQNDPEIDKIRAAVATTGG